MNTKQEQKNKPSLKKQRSDFLQDIRESAIDNENQKLLKEIADSALGNELTDSEPATLSLANIIHYELINDSIAARTHIRNGVEKGGYHVKNLTTINDPALEYDDEYGIPQATWSVEIETAGGFLSSSKDLQVTGNIRSDHRVIGTVKNGSEASATTSIDTRNRSEIMKEKYLMAIEKMVKEATSNL